MPVERATRQRSAIRSVIERAARPVSPQEILDDTRSITGGIGIATVYRALKKLVSDGSIRVVTLPGDPARYEMNGSAHHHHFQCTRCRRVYEIAGCPGDLRHLAPRGFTVERHEITLYGRCAHCRPRAA